MERILEYMSQQSWGSQSDSQNVSARISASPPKMSNDPMPPAEVHIVFEQSEELIMTPESEDEAEVDSDNEEERCSPSPPTPVYSPFTPPNATNFFADDEEEEEDLASFDEDVPLEWDWITGDLLAETEPLEFTGQLDFVDFPEGEDVELKYFMAFFTDEIIELIVRESNTYYQEVKLATQRPSRRLRDFKQLTGEDIMRMVAVRICMGVDQKPSQSNYWSSSPFYKSDIVPLIMTSDRYKDVHRFLHFSSNSEQDEGDRLHKIRNVWALFNERHGFHCTPGQNICIDESLVVFKGNLIFKQYIPSKAAKIGIKLFSIGDSETGYILSVMIYEGKGHQFGYSTKDFGFGGAVALELSGRYLNAGRCLYMDNYFVNARLAKELLDLNTNICGTLRKRLKNNPSMQDKMRKGQVKVYSSNGVMVERWRDKRDVCIMSTGHEHGLVTVRTKGGKEVLKPQSVLDYNKNSRAIDKMDMVTGTYDMNRKCTKWYKKLFFKMLEICLYNANIIFGKHHGPIPILEFKERVVLQILRKYGEHTVRRGRKANPQTQKRFTERHFADYIPPTPNKPRPSRDCVVCRKKGKRSQTRFMCCECDVALCVVPCFKEYHSR